jgi:hypothetical protein
VNQEIEGRKVEKEEILKAIRYLGKRIQEFKDSPVVVEKQVPVVKEVS